MVSGVSHPTRLRDLIRAALDSGMSYGSIAAKTATDPDGTISKSQVQKLATQGSSDGKVPMTVPQLKALAKAIGQPWSVVKDVVLAEAGMTEVATYDGASIVVARAQEELSPEEMEAWAAMAGDLVEMIRRRRNPS